MALKVFITGASSGIGEALAVYYAGQGAMLGLAARRAEFLDGLNQRLGGQHACYALDVCDAPALHAAAVDFMGRLGAPGVLGYITLTLIIFVSRVWVVVRGRLILP